MTAVAYENDAIYILCPLYHDSSETNINKSQTKIIEKKITLLHFSVIISKEYLQCLISTKIVPQGKKQARKVLSAL